MICPVRLFPFHRQLNFDSLSQGLCLDLKTITPVFASFHAILFAFSENESSFKSLIRLLLVCFEYYRHVSSPK